MNRSIFLKTRNYNLKKINLNFGPQHPAAHGVLRMLLSMENEIIVKSDVHIGLLHRGTEKLLENKMYMHGLPYFDRLDYVSMMLQEHAYCLSIEKLLNKTIDQNSYTRTIYDELTRILNHLLAIACHALDVGSMSPIFWGFEEREKIMEFYERVSGARMHAAFYRPAQKHRTLSHRLLSDIMYFINSSTTALNEINSLLFFNKIWRNRLIGVGTLTINNSLNSFLTGVMLRSTGIKNDIRKNPYTLYGEYIKLNWSSYVGKNGDCYDRFNIRMLEMLESLYIINSVVSNYLAAHKAFSLDGDHPYKNMETLIKHFKYWSEGFVISKGKTYACVESAKGEFGVMLIADGTNKPYRCKIRSPSYYSLAALPKLVEGGYLADLVTLIGTIDIVFGEVDK